MTANPDVAIISADPVLIDQVRKRSDPSWNVSVHASADTLAVEPTAIVIDLGLEGAPELIEELKRRWPSSLIGASLALPSKERWEHAERSGADLVANRGAFMQRFKLRLRDWLLSPGGRRIRLFGMNEVAGRLGVVHRMSDAVEGPIAVYHLKGEIFATQDRCPHAGRLLSEGELTESVVTCPGHGSQFDVRTGGQIRGPADGNIKSFRVVVENLEVFIELDA